MKRAKTFVTSMCLVGAILAGGILQQTASASEQAQDPKPKVAIVWTSGDREVAINMAFMYGLNALRFEWASEVHVVVWGPSAKLLSTDVQLQEQVAAMQEAGVVFYACKACADGYGVSETLQELGVEVKYMGQELTDYLTASDWHTITF